MGRVWRAAPTIRPLVNQPGADRLHADRDSVAFVAHGAVVDVLEIDRATRGGLGALDTAALVALADRFRGEFLEGLELLDFEVFDAWCTAERERVRTLHDAIRRSRPRWRTTPAGPGTRPPRRGRA